MRFHLAALLLLLFAGCVEKTGDVLLMPDGSVLEGEVLSIEGGRAVFSSGTGEIPSNGRIWMEDGSTRAGALSFAFGVMRAGSASVPFDSVLLVIMGDTSLTRSSFTIDASSGWTGTGIMVSEGDMLSLSARGLVVSETGRSNPDGQERYSTSVALVPGAVPGQLVFRPGNGEPVAAGSEWVGRSTGSGELSLAVNVPVEGSADARGTYTVDVRTGPGPGSSGLAVLFPSGR